MSAALHSDIHTAIYVHQILEEAMFNVHRQKVLDECKWTPGEGRLRYIEARTFTNTNALTPETYQEGVLNDQDIDDWLHQRDRFAPPSNPLLGKEEGGLRLLMCERLGFHPLDFGLSKASLLAIENGFGLSSEMLPLFKFNGGGHSYHFRPSGPHDQKPEQLVITIKVPQMYQVANYGLCLAHSFKTHITLGFMFGWNMVSDENWRKYMSTERPTHLELHSARISNLIKSEISNWNHPLLLPVILLEDHVYNADRYKGFDLSPRTTGLERRLGATKAGRNASYSKSLDFEVLGQNTTGERFEIITDINTTVTDVVTFTGNMKWDNRYCQFLRDISEEIRDLSRTTHDGGPTLDSTIATLSTLVASILEHAEALKTRLDIQLDVLYNLVAQVDSNVNATIAATTGLDSVAMKALAFVTTLFLPPTFIATLFSMSMFDWQANAKAQPSKSDEGTKIVSGYFGIYWAISLPLTIVVLLTWRGWWHQEKNRYRRRYPHVKLDPDISTRVYNRLKGVTWKGKALRDIEKLE